MEELDFHRPELDGRRQCASEYAEAFYDGSYPRCVLERDHTLWHSDNRYYWSDEQERKVTPMNKWLGYLVRLIGLVVALAIYGMLQLYFNPNENVPLWFLVVSIASLVAVFGCCTMIILADIKKKVKDEYHG